MGFLAPFYIAGLLAIGLPILFHLIRRNPRGRQVFSSLMFLTPSPPRLTRKSRLNNILLLLLRALALTILAFAFARPFIHQGADIETTKTSGRRIAILVDTSASMQRGDLWSQAKAQVDGVLKDLKPADDVALFFFDRETRSAVSFAQWLETEPSQRMALVKSRMAAAVPTWAPTRLGDALATVAGQLAEKDKNITNDRMMRQVVLISDLQQGSHAEALQGHEWPKDVVLEVHPVVAKATSNATLQWVSQAEGLEGAEEGKADTRLRVRVVNEAGSTKEQFTLQWANAKGVLKPAAAAAMTMAATGPETAPAVVLPLEPMKVYVAPGRSTIVHVPWPEAADGVADRLVLKGDDVDFDNTLYVVPPRAETVRVLYVGNDAAEDLRGVRYYLESALASTARRTVEIIAHPAAQPLTERDVANVRLIVIGAGFPEASAEPLRRILDKSAAEGAEGVADVLWVLEDTSSAPALERLLGTDKLEVREAPDKGGNDSYALLANVNIRDPLFAPFADARFSDFTKIHFWHHRHVVAPEGSAILATLDDGDVFLFERSIGKSRVRVMTSSWRPADSQLALSTKFVPLLEGLVQRKDQVMVEAQYTVLEPIALPPATPSSGQAPAARSLITPDGQRILLPPATATFEGAETPGIYKLMMNGQEVLLAVNLSPDESRTSPMSPDELERWGAKMGGRAAAPDEVAAERKLKIAELENHQKLWRWLIVGVLGLLAMETALAGRLARRGRITQGVA